MGNITYMREKLKLIQINTVCNVSTGHIMAEIQRAADCKGYVTLSIYGRRKGYPDLDCCKIGNAVSFWSHVALTTVLDLHGRGSYLVTWKLINVLRAEKPDIIHLHNLHGYYLNYPLLFNYLRHEFDGKVFWTLHDCWPFTGHCAFYTLAECNRWKKECNHCPCKKDYPISLFKDSSVYNYREKKKYFTGIRNLTILVPSEWMKKQVENSFMSEYRTVTINNGIDLRKFCYTKDKDIFTKYQISENHHILLGVAAYWTERKGIEDFIRLSEELSDEYRIVLVGVSRMQKKSLPHNIIGILRTEKVDDLVKIYSAADVFINPSIEESFSMVTVEAMACGTPVVVLDTSAVAELVTEDSGIVLHEHNLENYIQAIDQIRMKCNAGNMTRERIRQHAEQYSIENMTEGILKLYAGIDGGIHAEQIE